MIKKVVVIGPESTGKSSLCEQLAQYYNTIWCPEYARYFLLKHDKDYTYDDLQTIAKGQLALEDKMIEKINQEPMAGNKLCFIDTDMYVMKVWCEFVFGQCYPFILKEIVSRKYDLYLLCNTDLPWIQDELREYPNEAIRNKLLKIYKDLLINQSTPWVEISGKGEERVQKAIKAIENNV